MTIPDNDARREDDKRADQDNKQQRFVVHPTIFRCSFEPLVMKDSAERLLVFTTILRPT